MRIASLLLLLLTFVVGCTPPMDPITASESQLMIREAQTREFEDISKKQAMRAAIATLQDLSFILDKVDADLGTISGSKYKNSVNVKITVTIREKCSNLIAVRVNATYGTQTVEEPLIYQDFFSMLDKSFFLVRNQVD